MNNDYSDTECESDVDLYSEVDVGDEMNGT